MADRRQMSSKGMRQRAEKRLAEEGYRADEVHGRDPVVLVHELQVHQIELEMQNEELRRANREAEELRQRYQDLYDFAPVGFLTLDERGMIQEVNLTCAGMLGTDRGRLVKRPLASFIDKSCADLFELFLRRLRRMGAGADRERCEVRVGADGEPGWLLLEGEVADGEEQGRAIRIAVIDISWRKQAEEQIERLNTDLAERAAELETANRDLGAFNYTVAHDLRNPLNCINMNCQAIEGLWGAKLDDECRALVRGAYQSTLQMNALIEALLQFSRLAHVTPQSQVLELSLLAREVENELRHAEPSRQVTLKIADGIMGYGDPQLMRSVLANLLGNAWKYTSSRKVAEVEFDVTTIDGAPVFFVRDNGIGFTKAQAKELFVPFRRLPESVGSAGFGIGLATVERIIRRHGGNVWAEGKAGRGATFYFTLPERGMSTLQSKDAPWRREEMK